jgi:regulator of RNase E activity RraB
MAIEMNNCFLFINKAVESTKLSTDEIAFKIGAINSSNGTEEEKVEKLSLLLDRDIASRIKANSTIIDANMRMLNAKYQNINK